MKIIIYIFVFSIIISSIFSQDKLRWTFELINHGARAPHLGLDSDLKDFMNHTWIGQNELTGVGLRQSFLVGYRDRLRYIEEKELISEEYDPRDIIVYASENNRTLMSASALLHGLFLPGTGPVIANLNLSERAVPPVDPSTYEAEKKELDDDNCTALPGRMNLVPVHIFFSHEYFTQYETSKKCIGLKSYEEKNKKRHDVKKFLDEMTEKYGNNLKTLFPGKDSNLLKDYDFAYNIFDTIISLYFDGADEFEKILQILKVPEEDLLKDCYRFISLNTVGNGIEKDKEFINYLVSPLFSKILHFMDYRIEKDLNGEENYKGYDLPKYFILSGVTNSCGAFMSFMNKYFGTEIKYANFSTNIHLELFRENKGGDLTENNYRIEYYYNDDFLLSMPYSEFKNKIKSKLYSQDDVKKFCKEESKKDDNNKVNWFMVGSIIASVVVIILIVIIIIILKNRVRDNTGQVEDKVKLLRDTNRTSAEVNEQNNDNA